MLRVGLTGGIGSGKSTVAALLAARGAVVIDSDALAREVVAPGTGGLAAVFAEFGSDVRTRDGSLDRAALAARVFADPSARERLEMIVHPLVRARAAELEAAAVAADPAAVVVHEIPLLVETGQQDSFDVVVVVDVPPELQVERLTRTRRLSAREAQARMSAQASREARLAAAHDVVSNDRSVAELESAVDALWARLRTAARLGSADRDA